MLLFLSFGYAIEPNEVLQKMALEISISNQKFQQKTVFVYSRIQKINQSIIEEKSDKEKLNLLIEKDQLQTKLRFLKQESESEISKIRYLKGLQIIRILYDKTLSLDHHFSSVRTFSEINKMANPNQYPEFDKLKVLVASKKDKKTGFDLTSILGSNTIISVVNTFSNMLVSNLTKEEKENELASIDCILDFTLRMQNDLNTIFYETSFLQKSNEKIKTDIEILFKDYTKPIGYADSLDNCRNNDDWDNLSQKMEDYLAKQKLAIGPLQQKMTINLEFPIDRLI